MNFTFTSLSFWVVFPVLFILYWIIPNRYITVRKLYLLVVSYVIYMAYRPIFALVLLLVSVVTYVAALIITRMDHGKKRNIVASLFIFLSILPLLVFKYYNFINDSFYSLFSHWNINYSIPGLNWAIPIGISFFTFQALGYLLDVLRGETNAEQNIIDYLLFIGFFPQIASGPISKANELLPQIKSPSAFEYSKSVQGLKYLLWGMFIKIVIADRLGLFVDVVYSNYVHYSGATCLLASFAYSIQIYCDFCGYSLMAIGVANTLGFKLINNFRRPYFAESITDFWKRWHISLTRWLTKNVYITLGGSRCSRIRCWFNILVTFLVSGVWHGANWTFIFWGMIHAIVQIVEKAFGWNKRDYNKFFRTGRILITFVIINFAWIFFRLPTIKDAFSFISRVFIDFGRPQLSMIGGSSMIVLVFSILMLIFKEIREEYAPSSMIILNRKPVRWAIYISLFCCILGFGVLDGGQFIYANF